MTCNILLLGCVLWLCSLLCCTIVSGTSCVHTVSGYTIDLTDLNGKTISKDVDSWTYYYTPCQDGLTCTGSDGKTNKAMADQWKDGNDFCTAYLAVWDDVSPTYSDGVFTFTWSNGQTSNACSTLCFLTLCIHILYIFFIQI